MQDLSFFHQGTLNICGSLDIEEVLQNCLDFLKTVLPIQGMQACIYEPENKGVRILGSVSDFSGDQKSGLVALSSEAIKEIEYSQGTIKVVNFSRHSCVREHISQCTGLEIGTALILPLRIKKHHLGVVAAFSNGKESFTEEHARLFRLLHDPFAISVSNTLRYREVLNLQERLRDDNRYLTKELQRISGEEIIGENFGLREVMSMVQQVAPMDSTVLLLGESGVGKEIIANALHHASSRRNGPFIKVNCGALPGSLLDSELFGHEKGAFTGAVASRRGRFERADKGTIFLDEIADLSFEAQVRMLRVLQHKEFERIGSSKPVSVDVRILAATHRNLEDMVQKGEFREDLWYRLNVFPIDIPSLRERRADIPALVHYFIQKKCQELNIKHLPKATSEAIKRLQDQDWPGNVRELENVVEREIIRSQSGGRTEFWLEFPNMEENTLYGHSEPRSKNYHKVSSLDEVIKKHIREVLSLTGGKVQGEKGAAALLKINPSTLRHRMRRLDIPFGRHSKKPGK